MAGMKSGDFRQLISPFLKAKLAELEAQGGADYQVFERSPIPSSLRMVTFRSENAQIYYGELERIISGELTARDDDGNPVATAEFELPVRFGFVGADALAESDGWLRAGVSAGLAVFDKLDKETDGTIWRFHFGAWITAGREFLVTLGAHHFSNGENTPLKTKGPNVPFEFVALAVGLKF